MSCQQTIEDKNVVGITQQCFALFPQETFPEIISIFPEGEGDGFESRLPLKIFSALPVMEDGGIDRTVIDCWQHQMGQIANFSPLLTYFYFLKSKSLM